MNINFLKKFSINTSEIIDYIEEIFSTYNKRNKSDTLYREFNTLIKNNLLLCFKMLENGYVPTVLQSRRMHKKLMQDAIKESNFLFKYMQYNEYITEDCMTTYVLFHDLNTICSNKINIFDNFKEEFEKVYSSSENSKKLFNLLNSKIKKLTNQLSSIKTTNNRTYIFEFNPVQQKYIKNLISVLNNSLNFGYLIFNSIEDYNIFKNNVVKSVEKIEDHVLKYNGLIDDDFEWGRLRCKNNVQHYKLITLNKIKNSFISYDTKILEQNLLKKLKQQKIENKELEDKTLITLQNIKQESSITTNINQMKKHLVLSQQQQINRIQDLYFNIKSGVFEKKNNYEIDSLYNDIPVVIEKFISISLDYRTTLTNIEGKTPERLMIESFDAIENKFKIHWENINQNRVSELSIVQRSIKMKV